MISKVKGRIHSFQSLGTLDGPGVRFVVFFQGCPLRCSCCHNPDTWDFEGGEEYFAEQVIEKAIRFKEYFGKDGGITISGGEPLAQPDFAREIFALARGKGINTCLDTSGCILTDKVKKLLDYTERVLLDVKYDNQDHYSRHVGCDLSSVVNFLELLNEKKIKTTLRQVIIPTLNDNEESINFLLSLAKKYTVVDKIELLPFKKICRVKYEQLNIKFPFENMQKPSVEMMDKLNFLLGNYK